MFQWKSAASFLLTVAWLSLSLAFFAMLTSGGEVGMDLEVGPFIRLQGSPAILFTRLALAFGVVMLALFVLRRRTGYLLGLLWSAWWLLVLLTALFGSQVLMAERLVILLAIALFALSARFALGRFRHGTGVCTATRDESRR